MYGPNGLQGHGSMLGHTSWALATAVQGQARTKVATAKATAAKGLRELLGTRSPPGATFGFTSQRHKWAGKGGKLPSESSKAIQP